jgi:hypothetical protein
MSQRMNYAKKIQVLKTDKQKLLGYFLGLVQCFATGRVTFFAGRYEYSSLCHHIQAGGAHLGFYSAGT